MDTDGYAGKNRCEFTTTSPDLAEGVYELLASLGTIPRVMISRATLYGRDIGPKWRITFLPKLMPFRLRYKAERLGFDGPRKGLRVLRFIVSVEPAGLAPVKCIKTSSPSHLYLAGNAMIPTHNSTTCAALGLHESIYRRPSFGLVIAPTQDQSSELMLKFDEFRGAVELPSDYLSTDTKLAVRFANGNRFIARPGSEKSARSFSAVTLLLEDEASRVLDDLYNSVRPMLAVSDGRHILMSTPFGKRGHFFHIWDEQRDLWQWFEIPAEKCPRITKEFLAEEKRINPWFEQEYHCVFAETVDSVFSYDQIAEAISDDVEPLFQCRNSM
jgi:hypothetical protein